MSAATAPALKTRKPPNWLSNRLFYTICGPLATIAGAGTTIAAPALLDPASFARFILLMSIFQYVADFDLGLSRLMDRTFSGQGTYRLEAVRSFMLARLCVAAFIGALILIAAALARGILTAAAGMAGVAVMLSCGPIAFYRATSNTYAFTLYALLMQAGLGLPRFAGLWVGGISGCILVIAGWYLMTAVVLNAPFLGVLHRRGPLDQWPILSLIKESLPLCAFNAMWLLYLLSSRWFSWLMSSPTDAGLFAFGANMLQVGIGVIAVIVAVYYPRHLAIKNSAALSRELTFLIVVLALGVLAGGLFSRFALRQLFPHFQDAALSTAVALIPGIPLGLCTWLIPLVIARSRRPWSEGIIMFGASLIGLFVLMLIGSHGGVLGQTWACLPPAILLLGMQLYLASQAGLLSRKHASGVWLGMMMAVAVYGAVWHVLFI